jgi:hypothetical protein
VLLSVAVAALSVEAVEVALVVVAVLVVEVPGVLPLAPTKRPFSKRSLMLPVASTPFGPWLMDIVLPPILIFPDVGSDPSEAIPEMADVACCTMADIASARPCGTPPPVPPSAWT